MIHPNVSLLNTSPHLNAPPPDIDECALRQDNCDQLCQNTDAGYTCTCYPGYTLTPIPASTDNSSRCELTDLGVKAVCLTTPPRCPQLCVGSPSGAACMCWPGYAKNSAGVCQGRWIGE